MEQKRNTVYCKEKSKLKQKKNKKMRQHIGQNGVETEYRMPANQGKQEDRIRLLVVG